MFQVKRSQLACLFLSIFLSGCQSFVKLHDDAHKAQQLITQANPLSDMTVVMTPEAQKKLDEGGKGFSMEKLLVVLRQRLEEKQLLDPKSANGGVAEMVIKDIHIRHAAAAVMLGFFAGADSVSGDLLIYGKDRTKNAGISFSYPMVLGGWAVADQERRFNFMYGGLAEKLESTLLGTDIGAHSSPPY